MFVAGRGGGVSRWETGRVEEDKRPTGGKTLGFILLAMVVILALIVGLGIWASRTG